MTIVRNEAGRLPKLLESLRAFRARGGEIVVLDTGSDDATPEIARAFKCAVFVERAKFNGRLSPADATRINRLISRGGEGPFVNAGERTFDFARARNRVAALASNDFQLAVDGTDVVDHFDIDAIDARIHATDVPLLHFETRLATPAGWHLEVRDYLYDRRFMKWKGRAHNHLAPRTKTTRALPSTVLPRQELLVSHHTNLDKPRGYQFAGMALEYLDHPKSARWGFLLGRALTALGHNRSGMEIALSLDRPDVPPSVRSAALCIAARCAALTGGTADDIESLLFRAADRDPERRDPWMRLATRTLAQGKVQAAASLAAAALAIPPRAGMSEPEENLTVGPHAILYWALLFLGRRDEARPHFERCRVLNPANPVYASHASLFAN